MKITEIREMTTEELQQKVADLKKDLFTQRFSLATNNLDNHEDIRNQKGYCKGYDGYPRKRNQGRRVRHRKEEI